MSDKPYAVPLHEQLANVPRDARLVIDHPDGNGTSYIPVGRMCYEAADALRAAPPQREWVGLTDEDRWELVQNTPSFDETVSAVEAKLKEKNT